MALQAFDPTAFTMIDGGGHGLPPKNERRDDEADIWQREARAYCQAIIDQSEWRNDQPELAAYADGLARQYCYPSKHHRATLAAAMAAFLAGFSTGWHDGNRTGYADGRDDGRMVASAK